MAVAPGDKITAAGWNAFDTRITAAQNSANAAQSSGGAPGSAPMDSFTGATDDAKLDAALSYAAAQSFIPAISLPTNRMPTFNTSRTPFSGLKIIGGPGGNRNPELAGGKYISSVIKLGCGSGTSSWFVGTGSYYNIYMANFGVQGNAGSAVTQFWHQPLSTAPGLYSCRFESLGFNFMRYVFGQPATPCAMTQVELVGHWTVNNLWDTQFTLAGSDCQIFDYVNIGPSSSPAQTGTGGFEIVFSGMSNTKVGMIYSTGLNGWNGVKVTGNSDGLDIFGGVFEGYKAGTPAPGNVLRIEGGSGNVYGGNFGQGMGGPTAGHNGLIEQTGGEWNYWGPEFYKGNMAETVPCFYLSAGRAVVIGAKRRQAESWSGRPRYHIAGGTLYNPDSSMTLV